MTKGWGVQSAELLAAKTNLSIFNFNAPQTITLVICCSMLLVLLRLLLTTSNKSSHDRLRKESKCFLLVGELLLPSEGTIQQFGSGKLVSGTVIWCNMCKWISTALGSLQIARFPTCWTVPIAHHGWVSGGLGWFTRSGGCWLPEAYWSA